MIVTVATGCERRLPLAASALSAENTSDFFKVLRVGAGVAPKSTAVVATSGPDFVSCRVRRRISRSQVVDDLAILETQTSHAQPRVAVAIVGSGFLGLFNLLDGYQTSGLFCRRRGRSMLLCLLLTNGD
jgi:hypothetical protein